MAADSTGGSCDGTRTPIRVFVFLGPRQRHTLAHQVADFGRDGPFLGSGHPPKVFNQLGRQPQVQRACTRHGHQFPGGVGRLDYSTRSMRRK